VQVVQAAYTASTNQKTAAFRFIETIQATTTITPSRAYLG
jgi:hypothetical protein